MENRNCPRKVKMLDLRFFPESSDAWVGPCKDHYIPFLLRQKVCSTTPIFLAPMEGLHRFDNSSFVLRIFLEHTLPAYKKFHLTSFVLLKSCPPCCVSLWNWTTLTKRVNRKFPYLEAVVPRRMLQRMLCDAQ